ncbi:hypothetical protein F110043I8_01550 [Ruminococcus sp. f11]
MTKIKNTKKGMAKKTLSMSLVVAMLATSNVPVWASEFSDGSDATAFSAEAETPAVDDTEDGTVENATAATASIKSIVFQQQGKAVQNEAVVKQGTITAIVTLDRVVNAATATLVAYDTANSNGRKLVSNVITNGNVVSVSYDLKQSDVGSVIGVEVYEGADIITHTNATIKVVESATVLTGTPTIDAGVDKDKIVAGTVLTAKTDNMGPEGTTFKYQWQATNEKGEWVNIDGETSSTYTVSNGLYGKQVRVAVYSGDRFETEKASCSESVAIGARKLSAENENGGIATAPGYVRTMISNDIKNKGKVFNVESKRNELVADKAKADENDICVAYKNLKGNVVTLKYGKDYTLTYDQLYHLGTVNVTVTILPTENTDYTNDTYTGLTYDLVPGTTMDGYAIEKSGKAYEYNGQKVTPEVSKVTYNGQTLPTSDYTIQEIGPDAGTYSLSVNVTDRTLVTKDRYGKDVTVTIAKKNMANHDADFDVVIPEEVWKADKTDVEKNGVKNAKIKMYDTVADPNKTNDLLAGNEFDITCVNWSDSAINKQITITAKDKAKNYQKSISRKGEATKSDINEFKSAFLNALAGGNNLIYNGKEQDYLGKLLSTNNGSITLNGTKLFLNRDFTYKITQGGTNAGDVSYTITGAKDYADTEMILSNAYKIQQATFNDDTQVKDNRATGNKLIVSFNPSLGDKGADISNYNILAKDVYKAWMADGHYDLTLDKDFWLDKTSTSNRTLVYTPTVAENKVAGHGKNENFKQTAGTTNRTSITAELTAKDLSDKDITVKVVDASYNSGKLVTPTIKVVYTDKDGKEYEISNDYYTVEIERAAIKEGDKGKINVKAKTITDTAKYPQMYTGNQMVEYTVGTPSLEGGKIVATNGLETLPSVAYSAEQAGSSKGIILEAGKYVVKDKSGNVVDPKYYDVTFSDNKKAGTATITVTGKAPYKGSVSANFKITNATLPSGTVTLMSDKLSKTYTGEEISLVKGTDYTITGELAQLKEGTDYMVSYENAVNVTTTSSKAKIKFVGIGSYAGELVKTFDITPAKITASDVTLGDVTYAGGKTVKPSVTITVPGGKTTLVEGTDYIVDYVPAATNVGDKGKVVITYKDNANLNTADSVKEVEYGVTAKDLKDVTIAAVADQEATGEQVKPSLTVTSDSVTLKEGVDYQVTYGENKEVGTGTATITPVNGNKNFTGSQKVSFNIIKAKPEVGQAMITDVVVKGNTVTPVLSSDVDGAVGYDYVIATEEDYENGRVDISKNVLKTNTNFYYVQEGTYYAYCHAWKRDENGKKVFGAWSNLKKFEVTATTPSTPKITKVKVSGSTVTVTYTKSKDATGYDVVLGSSVKSVNGEKRPVDYGTLVKKNVKGSTVTVTFKNVKKGTYYAGLHSFNRTSENGSKVFSKWSGTKTVTVK